MSILLLLLPKFVLNLSQNRKLCNKYVILGLRRVDEFYLPFFRVFLVWKIPDLHSFVWNEFVSKSGEFYINYNLIEG